MAWNNAIGARFFNQDRGGVRVFLYVTTEVVAEVGAPHNADLSDFVAAVKAGPPRNTRHGWGICQQALQVMEDWRHEDWSTRRIWLTSLFLFSRILSRSRIRPVFVLPRPEAGSR